MYGPAATWTAFAATRDASLSSTSLALRLLFSGCGLLRGFRSVLVVLLRRPQLLHRAQRGDLLALRERDQVDDRLAPGGAPGLRQLMHLEPEHATLAGEDEHVRMRAGDEDLLDEVLFGGARAGLPAPSAPLRAIEGDRIPLHVPLVAEGDHHVLFGDQVLVGEVAGLALDVGAAWVREEALHFAQLVLDHVEQELLRAEDRLEPRDQGLHFGQLGDDLLLFQAGEALQLHLEDRLGLISLSS